MQENLLCRHHRPFAILGCTLSCALAKKWWSWIFCSLGLFFYVQGRIQELVWEKKWWSWNFCSLGLFLCIRYNPGACLTSRLQVKSFFISLFVVFLVPVGDVFLESPFLCRGWPRWTRSSLCRCCQFCYFVVVCFVFSSCWWCIFVPITFPLQRMTTLDQIFPLSANMWMNLRGWCPSG